MTNTMPPRSCLRLSADSLNGSYEDGYAFYTNNTTTSSSKKCVRFHRIQIRKYERTIGDNPSVSSGPALSISWNYLPETEECIPFEEYESLRQMYLSSRKKSNLTPLPRSVREEILMNDCGISFIEMAKAIHDINEIKSQRIESNERYHDECTALHCEHPERHISLLPSLEHDHEYLTSQDSLSIDPEGIVSSGLDKDGERISDQDEDGPRSYDLASLPDMIDSSGHSCSEAEDDCGSLDDLDIQDMDRTNHKYDFGFL